MRERVLILAASLSLALCAALWWSTRAPESERAAPTVTEAAAARERDVEEEVTASAARVPSGAREVPSASTIEDSGCSVSGRIRSRLGFALASAEVVLAHGRVIDAESGRLGPKTCMPVLTNLEGVFVCRAALEQGEPIQLFVTHPAHAPAAFERVFPMGERVLDVGELALEGGGEISGRVLDSEGKPVIEAVVELEALDSRARSARSKSGSAGSNALGEYAFAHVPAGSWRVAASADGRVGATSEPLRVLNDASIAACDLVLGPGFTLEGVVLSHTGLPVPRATITLRPPQGSSLCGRSDATGRFSIDHLPGAPLELVVRATGFLTFIQHDLDPRRAPNELVVTLEEGLVLEGNAVDAASGAPAESLAVHAVRMGDLPPDGELYVARVRERMSASGGLVFGNDLGRPVPSPGGAFTLSGLDEGVYQVLIQSPVHTRWCSEVLELRRGTTPRLSAALERGLTIRGRTLDSKGHPVAGARVQLHALGTESSRGGFPVQSTRSSGAGEFTLAQAPPGSYQLRAEARSFAMAELAIELKEDRKSVELELPDLR